MTGVVNPIPRDPSEIVAWFLALSPADVRLALIGAATASSVALLLVLGTMVLMAMLHRKHPKTD